MKLLITGGAGFIGHNVVRVLEAQGHTVSVIDNFTNYGIIPDSELVPLHQQRMSRIATQQIYTVDIRDQLAVASIFEQFDPDVVIHCAAYPRAKAVDLNPVEGSQVLTQGLINLLKASEQIKLQRFVYISSSMVYGDFDSQAHEDTVCRPRGIYGILKLAGEALTRDLCVTAGIDHVIVRPSAVYGPHDVLDRVVSRFLHAAIHNQDLVVCGANEYLDFTYIDDVVDGIVLAALSGCSSGGTYNITRGRARSLLEAAELSVAIAGGGRIQIASANPRFPSRSTLSNVRAGQDFGYAGKTEIEQGFRQYHEWITNTLLRR